MNYFIYAVPSMFLTTVLLLLSVIGRNSEASNSEFSFPSDGKRAIKLSVGDPVTLLVILGSDINIIKLHIPSLIFSSQNAANRLFGQAMVQGLPKHQGNSLRIHIALRSDNEDLNQLKDWTFSDAYNDVFVFLRQSKGLGSKFRKTCIFQPSLNCFRCNFITQPVLEFSCMENVEWMMGGVLRVMATPILPHIVLDSKRNIIGGGHYTILTSILRHLNRTWCFDLKGGGTGVFKNGTWTGMTGAVLYGTADVSLLTSATAERYKVIDIVWVGPDSVLFVTRLPQLTVEWKAIWYPFSAILWALFGLAFGAVCGTMWTLLRLSNFHGESLYISLIIPYQITLDQGFDIRIPTEVKLLGALWMYFILVMSTAYKSDLISYFTFPQEEEIARTFAQLDLRKDYSVQFNYFAGNFLQLFLQVDQGTTEEFASKVNSGAEHSEMHTGGSYGPEDGVHIMGHNCADWNCWQLESSRDDGKVSAFFNAPCEFLHWVCAAQEFATDLGC